MKDACSLVLPLPPSVNNYWRIVTRGGRKTIRRTPEAKAYRILAAQACRVQRAPSYGKMLLSAVLFIHTRKGYSEGDIDNYEKGLLDALEHAGLYHNDKQVIQLNKAKRGPISGGGVLFQIRPSTPEEIAEKLKVEPEFQLDATERMNRYGF